LVIYIVPIGHGFSFFGHGKSMLKKRGHPASTASVLDTVGGPGGVTGRTPTCKKM